MRPLAVVMPVFNAYDDTARSLAALARHRGAESSVVLVDDASTDPRIPSVLAGFADSQPRVTVVRMQANGGFVAAANRGAAAADAASDLLFLNSDAVPTASAFEEMAHALRSRPDAATCCPLSNNATFLSVPRFQQPNAFPPGVDEEAMAMLVRECAGDLRVLDIPTPVGFCMWVRREAWERWGPFDRVFGRGYGEEDDFGQRVRAAGAAIVCAPRAFVRHGGEASFGRSPEVLALRSANIKVLRARWPSYPVEMREFCQANPLRPLQEKLWDLLLSYPERRATHVMHVVDRWEREGDLRTHMLELCRSTGTVENHTIVAPTPDRGAWVDAIDGEVERAIRVVGIVDLPRRFASFLAASPATRVRFHGTATPAMLAAVRAAGREAQER
jgi:GT2 family glycosyltransferase